MKDTYIWKLLLAILIILYSAKFAAFFPDKWFRQGKDLKVWKGNMFSVYSSGGLIDKETYSSLSEYYCAEYTSLPYDFSTTEINYYDAYALCSRLGSLNSGIPVYIVFSIFSFLIGIGLMITFKYAKTKKSKLCCSLVLNIFQTICEFVCTIALGASSSLTLYGDCHYLSIYGNTTQSTNVCGDMGAVFSFFASFAILIASIVMIICVIIFNCTTEVVRDVAPEMNLDNPPLENQLPVLNLPEIPSVDTPIEPNHPEILILKKEKSINNVD